MFKIDRNQPQPGGFLKQPGIYASVITVQKEITCTAAGDAKIRLAFETDLGTAYDDYINVESLWWKLNALLLAVDPDGSKIPIKDGVNVDLSTTAAFADFLKKFNGMAASFAYYEEEFAKRDGSKGTAWRVRLLDPRRAPNEQLSKKIMAMVLPAPSPVITPEEPDEVPF